MGGDDLVWRNVCPHVDASCSQLDGRSEPRGGALARDILGGGKVRTICKSIAGTGKGRVWEEGRRFRTGLEGTTTIFFNSFIEV